MDKEEAIQQAKEILKEIYKRGLEITKILEEKNKLILEKANSGKISVNELFVDTNIFYYSLFESFWKLFKQISDNIENPLIQPWVRVFIEQSCDIFLYYGKKDEEKKQIVCKYWLCALGFSKDTVENLNYNFFVNLLDNLDEKQKFLDLEKKGFPSERFNKIWHELFSAITTSNLPNAIEKYFFNLENKNLTKEQLSNFFGDMSLYHHPNILTINNLEQEEENKAHLFRCFALMYISSRSLIRLFAKEIINEPNKELSKELENKANILINKLKESRNLK